MKKINICVFTCKSQPQLLRIYYYRPTYNNICFYVLLLQSDRKIYFSSYLSRLSRFTLSRLNCGRRCVIRINSRIQNVFQDFEHFTLLEEVFSKGLKTICITQFIKENTIIINYNNCSSRFIQYYYDNFLWFSNYCTLFLLIEFHIKYLL